MAVNFDNLQGESFGNINDIFFKKDGKSILPTNSINGDGEKIRVSDIVKNVADTVESARKNKTDISGHTIIQISKDILDEDDDVFIQLTQLEEKRRTYSAIRNKFFVDINNGEEVLIVEKTEMFNGTNLFTVKHTSTQKLVTYPRSKFVGKNKQFVPKGFYIREAERAIEDTIEQNGEFIFELVQDMNNLIETSDGKYLEMVLDEPLDIFGGLPVPNKVQIPVKRMFDLEYKLMMLEKVICLNNKIASLLFVDVWF